MRAAALSVVIAVAGLSGLAWTSLAEPQSSESEGARSLYYNQWTGTLAGSPNSTTEVPKPSRPVGVRYWIALEGLGPVVDSHTFATGQRVRLYVRSNTDGYLAVWAVGAGGRLQLMMPSGDQPAGMMIKGGEDYVSPGVRFQPPAQDERMFLAFARQKRDLPSLDAVAAVARQQTGARDLLVETDERTAGQIGTYIVTRRGGAIAREIRLHHVAP